MSTIIAMFLPALLFFGMLRATAYRWRHLAQSYAGETGPALDTRHGRSAVLMGLGAFQSIKGIMTIGVHEHGVTFRVMRIFSAFHEPLFVPYSDIKGWRTTWYLNAKSSELEFRRSPDVKVILPTEDAEWIKGYARGTMMLRDIRPAHGNVGRGWHAFTVLHLIYCLGAIGVAISILMR